MGKRFAHKDVVSDIDQLAGVLEDLRSRAAALTRSKLEAGEAQSIADTRAGAETALDNMDELRDAVRQDDASSAQIAAQTMQQHVLSDIARAAIIDDLNAVLAEARQDLASRVGKHRNPYKTFIDDGERLINAITGSARLAERIRTSIEAWTSQPDTKEITMADQDNVAGITAELQGIGRQLSFLAASGSVQARTGSGGSGRFRAVSDQLMASLDALGLPHHGVQFNTSSNGEASRDNLIEGLLDNFREAERDGNPIFIPGRSEGRERPSVAAPSQILSGAARVAARLVRAEADNILDILDRLPDMTRFRTRSGVPSAADASRAVAERFEDLDEVMADAIGINLPRAEFALRRAAKALLDFFDYANLERELASQLDRRGGRHFLPGQLPRPVPDDDEVGQRRSVAQSEELRHEIAEIAESFMRLAQRVRTPLSASLGTAAARLEQSLTAASASSYALRDILVRSGSSIPEQEVQFFSTGLDVEIEESGAEFRARPRRRQTDRSVDRPAARLDHRCSRALRGDLEPLGAAGAT